MLKNWIVTTQAVKNGSDGVMVRERYILSASHPNHRQTEALIPLFGSEQTSQLIAIAGEKFRLKQKLECRQGGRPLSSYAMEFCLTLPKGHRPSILQWKHIIKDCCHSLAAQLELRGDEKKQFYKQIRAVCHQQTQSGKTGSGDHVHLIIGKVIAGRVLKDLQRKSATKTLKLAFNAAVLLHVGVSHTDYTPHELNRGKRLENWRYQHNKAQESLEVQKLINKLQVQADKWFKAHKESDSKQICRQFKRLTSTLSELSMVEVSNNTQQDIKNLQNVIKQKSGKKSA
jgi:hypothetical protein